MEFTPYRVRQPLRKRGKPRRIGKEHSSELGGAVWNLVVWPGGSKLSEIVVECTRDEAHKGRLALHTQGTEDLNARKHLLHSEAAPLGGPVPACRRIAPPGYLGVVPACRGVARGFGRSGSMVAIRQVD